MPFVPIFGALLIALALAGVGYTVFAIRALGRFRARPRPAPVPPEPVTLLKPLHGAEPRLAENLATFLDQEWAAPIRLVAGVARADDPAVAAAEPATVRPNRDVRLVINGAQHGANAKVSNLINMMADASGDLLVLSDSDMVVPRDYLAKVAATLSQNGVGAATCLYRGRGDAGFWSVLGAAQVSYQFLPNVLVSLALGQGEPCMGSTIALRRETLDAIGGFPAFADILADDHAIGAAVRAHGQRIAVAPLLLTHAGTERSFGELVRHELRWAATVRQLVSLPSYAGMIVTFPVPIALLACLVLPKAGAAILLAAALARLALRHRIDRWAGAVSAPIWMLPLRDCLSFGLFVASFFVRSVDWRGQRLKMADGGRIATELTHP